MSLLAMIHRMASLQQVLALHAPGGRSVNNAAHERIHFQSTTEGQYCLMPGGAASEKSGCCVRRNNQSLTQINYYGVSSVRS